MLNSCCCSLWFGKVPTSLIPALVHTCKIWVRQSCKHFHLTLFWLEQLKVFCIYSISVAFLRCSTCSKWCSSASELCPRWGRRCFQSPVKPSLHDRSTQILLSMDITQYYGKIYTTFDWCNVPWLEDAFEFIGRWKSEKYLCTKHISPPFNTVWWKFEAFYYFNTDCEPFTELRDNLCPTDL